MAYKGKKILEFMVDANNYNNALADLCLKNINNKYNTVVDFGAGIGTISQLLKDRGYVVECVENDEQLFSTLCKKDFKTHKDINSYDDCSIKNIVSFNVFEHIENDVEEFKTVNKKLCQDGKFFLFLPAYSFLYSSFDKNLGHYRRYDKCELTEIVVKCGFKIERLFYFDCLGFVFAFLYKTINKKGIFLKLYINLYDKLIFPISKFLDMFFRKFFGKNIVLILTKNSM